MGLSKAALRFIAREHKKTPYNGPVLTMGRQNLSVTESEIIVMLVSEGITPNPDPINETLKQTNIPQWVSHKYISDVYFFHLLGINEVKTIDYADHEGADIIHDFNTPVPQRLYNAFDLIIDSGTIEHIFDMRQALINISLMLKPGGRIIHMTPTNNYVQHGFYQISPTLYFDYYNENKFVDLRGFLVEHDRYRPWKYPFHFFELSDYEPVNISSKQALITVFVAKKTHISTADRVPIQTLYKNIKRPQGSLISDNGFPPPRKGLISKFKAMIPLKIKEEIKYWILRFVHKDHSLRPWGLRKWDSF